MLRTRLIPCLQLRNGSLVKTRQFDKFSYLGDPANTCRIFNECEVDELVVVDIQASAQKKEPNFALLKELAEECFMPVAYGGGITNVTQAEKILRLGMEKVIIGTESYANPNLVTEISDAFGAQCVVAALDVSRNGRGQLRCKSLSGKKRTGKQTVEWAKTVEELGAGEILLTSIEREGMWTGFDLDMVKQVSQAVNIPVIAHGGCANLGDARQAVDAGASAIALGSMVVFQKKGMGVLVNFPTIEEQAEWGFS